ncbi:DUF3800 domain-containing protein [Deferribacter abyssi]|uniref:DUF3800 domain-containing protein n=1 Tax=Deferribacter abyssi TaxID=213806 RepID=UPI003C278D60
MSTYFCFSDEAGYYKQDMSNRQLRSHPFYVRVTLMMNSNEWKTLNDEFRKLKEEYNLPLAKELKWSYLWLLRKFKNKEIPDDHEIKFLDNFNYHTLVEFVEKSLMLINRLKYKKIIVTYTRNSKNYKIKEKEMLKFHLQEHLQRIQMELQFNRENLAVLFIDPINNEKNEFLRKIYFDLYNNGDFIKNYNCIKDSLNIENSHHSVGIQITDYIAGVFLSFLKSSKREKNYFQGMQMFFNYIYPNLRRVLNGNVIGYGIREVPKDDEERQWCMKKLKELESVTL